MRDVFICDYVRTPIGRYGGALAKVRADDLAAIPIRALIGAQSRPRLAQLSTRCIFGCANQAGEDNRNVARMALLLAGLPDGVPGVTINRLCASGLDAVGAAARADQGRRDRARDRRRRRIDVARALRHGQGARAPFQRTAEIYDTTIGWRFVNPLMKRSTASIPCRRPARTSPRNSRSAAPTRTPSRCARSSAPAARRRAAASPTRSSPVEVPRRQGAAGLVDRDEHPRADTTLEALAKLKPIVRAGRHGDGGQCLRRQ